MKLVSSVINTTESWLENEARKLLDANGLEDWSFILTNHKTSVGYCWDERKTIGVSRFFLDSPRESLLDTVKHEIAHALVGCSHGHNRTWKTAARSLGATPASCAVEGSVKNSADYRYIIKCPACGWKVYRYRMKRRNFGSICPECGTVVEIYGRKSNA